MKFLVWVIEVLVIVFILSLLVAVIVGKILLFINWVGVIIVFNIVKLIGSWMNWKWLFFFFVIFWVIDLVLFKLICFGLVGCIWKFC